MSARSLKDYLALIEKESAANKKVKTVTEGPGAKVAAKYAKLTEDEIKTLVVDDKWLATPGRRRADRTGPRVAGTHRAYPATGRTLRHAAAAAHRGSRNPAARVDEHLKKMGAVWK